MEHKFYISLIRLLGKFQLITKNECGHVRVVGGSIPNFLRPPDGSWWAISTSITSVNRDRITGGKNQLLFSKGTSGSQIYFSLSCAINKMILIPLPSLNYFPECSGLWNSVIPILNSGGQKELAPHSEALHHRSSLTPEKLSLCFRYKNSIILA